MSDAEATRELVEFVARALVEAPDDVEVTVHEGGSVIELYVGDEDVDRVMGATAEALQALVRVAAGRDRGIELEIVGHDDEDDAED